MAFYLFLAFALLVGIALGFAWWKGGMPERIASGMFLIAWLVSMATDSPYAIRYHEVQLNYLLIDFTLLVGLLLLTRATRRRWTVLAASLQSLIVLAHLARAISPHQWALVYMIMTTIWPYLQLLVLIGGTVTHWRRTAVLESARS
ncbi:hypothetical protein RZN05_03445 [Sphingomonas sp. HF-S4]|uniref:Rod shape-determining protein MreD n=1 Tax=Sphingomonas agrestis TaxID=3080540 RepID=A0ABU3Y475_9SPHN|nr:hypothetical protein [Sphingomonas sp. HF-S4]MDV3456023.1 hypothetical protein [Sphingomonas sp. HF-S4]